MRAVDDQPMCRSGIGRHFGADGVHGLGHRSGIVIRAVRGTTQHHMAVGIAERFDHGGAAEMVDAEERVLLCGSEAGIGRSLDGTVRGVLEADRHGQAGRQLPVHLAFRIARADRTPANRVGNILRTGRLQKLRGRRQTLVKHAKQRAAGQQQALPDIAAAVDIRIVDQTLPTDRGARLLEIHAHDDQQLAIQLAFQRGQATRVIERGLRIVNGTRTDNHQQAIVLTVQAGTNLITRIGDDLLRLLAQRQVAQHLRRRGQHFEFQHAAVHDAADAHLVLPARHVGLHQRILALIHGLPNGT